MSTSNRNYGIDLLKVVATMLVFSVHHFHTIGFYNIPYNGGLTMILSTSIYVITLTCVPLFLVISGLLLRNRDISSSHYKKAIFFLIEVLILYLIGNFIVGMQQGNFNFQSWLFNTTKGFFNPSYYIGLYFSLYLVAPFLNKFFYALTDIQKKYFMLILIITISLPVAINNIFNITFFDTRPTSLWSVLYYFLGLYISYFRPKISKIKVSLYVGIISITYGIVLNVFLRNQIYNHLFGYYQNIFVLSITYLLTILVYNIQIESLFLKKILPIFSSMTLTFYLMSSLYSDIMAINLIKLSGTLLYDLWTILPRVFLSMLFSLPVGLLMVLIMGFITKKSKIILHLD